MEKVSEVNVWNQKAHSRDPLPPARLHFLEVPQPFNTALAGDQMFYLTHEPTEDISHSSHNHFSVKFQKQKQSEDPTVCHSRKVAPQREIWQYSTIKQSMKY